MEVTQSPASSRTEFGRHLLRYAPAVVLPAVIGVAFTGIFTRVFDAGAFGHYVLTISAANLLAAVASSWLQQGITRFLPGVTDEMAIRSLKAAFLLCSLVTFLAMVALGVPVVAFLTFETSVAWSEMLWPALLFVLCNSLFLPFSTLLQAELRSGRYSVYAVSSSALRLLFALVLTQLLLWKHPVLLVWANAMSVAVLVPMLVRDAGLPSVAGVLRGWRSITPTAKRIASYGVPLMGWVVASGILESSDRYIIQFFRGSEEVGVYAANYTVIASAAQLVSAPILFATHSLLMKAHNEGDREMAGFWLERITEAYIVLGSIAVGAAYLLSEDIARFMLGPSFREGHIIIPVVLIGIVVWQWSAYAHKPLEFANRTHLLFGMAVASAVLNIVLNVIFVPHFGFIAAAYTTLASYACYGLIAFLLGQRTMPWVPRLKRSLGFLLTCVVLAMLGALTRSYVENLAGYVWGLVVAGGMIVTMGGVAAMYYPMWNVLRHLKR